MLYCPRVMFPITRLLIGLIGPSSRWLFWLGSSGWVGVCVKANVDFTKIMSRSIFLVKAQLFEIDRSNQIHLENIDNEVK